MKKVLFVCDGSNFSQGGFEFLKLLKNKENLSVTGLFFTQMDAQQLISISYMPMAEPYTHLKEKEKAAVKKCQEQFIKKCKENDFDYKIHDTAGEWDETLFATESRFSDLAIISSELFGSGVMQSQPNIYMREALQEAECPVVLVPENFRGLERIVFAYDGKKESMFAMKQFCYVLSEFSEVPVEFVYLKKESSEEIPHVHLLKEYAREHFNSLGILKLHFDAEKFFNSWVNDKKNGLVVTGSFSRSGVSNFLKRSFSEKIIHDLDIPVFIAHNN